LNKKIRIFKDATAIITGASSGIGKAIALELSQRECTVVLADRQFSLAEALAKDINAKGGTAWASEVDVSDYISVQALVNEAVKKTGRIDYMINNAGIGMGGLVEDYELDDWNRTIDVNLRGVTNGIQACYKVMIAQGFGHIVNTSSIAGLIPSPGSVAYTACKFAVAGLSQALRVEAELYGIRVSVLCPGAVRTPILEGGKYGKLPKGISPEKAIEYWGKLPISPDLFAKKAVDQIARNKAVIIFPRFWGVLYWIYRFSWRMWFMESKRGFIKAKKLIDE
jgi:NAD(P)-dependent dehydrogenase (short-subunit alcohol dehydrogenase family)